MQRNGSLPPGASEHNMGVAMDIVNTKESFENTKEFKWLQAHAADYGFILRYPKDKVSITKVAYEPWHWRYVGVEDAKKDESEWKMPRRIFGHLQQLKLNLMKKTAGRLPFLKQKVHLLSRSV